MGKASVNSLKIAPIFGKIQALLLVVLVITIVFAFTYSIGSSTPAGAAAGDAGGGGAGTGNGYHVVNGWGWYTYEIGVEAPSYVASGTWSSIASACTGYNRVIGFTLLDPSGRKAIWGVDTIYSSRYPNEPYIPASNLGNSGGNWVTWTNARSLFEALLPTERTNSSGVLFHWVGIGTPVASWYCYEPKSNWTTTGTTTANRTTALPGDTITWSHRLRNNGPTSTSPYSIYSFPNGDAGTGVTRTGVMSSGQTRTWTSTYVVKASDAGRNLCQTLRWEPVRSTSTGGATGNGTATDCVRVLYDFTISGTTTVNKTTAKPDDVLEWTRRVINNGPTATDVNIRVSTFGSGFDNAADGEKNIFSKIFAAGESHVPSWWKTYTVKEEDLGKTLCQELRWTPINDEGDTGGSAKNCTDIPFDHNLAPQTPPGLPLTAMLDTEISNINASVENTGGTSSPPDTKAAVLRFIVKSPADPSGSAIVSGSADLSSNDNYLCKIAQAAMSQVVSTPTTPTSPQCDGIGDERTDSFDASGSTAILTTDGTDNLADLATAGAIRLGDYVCYMSVVNNYLPSKGELNWLYSAPHCVAFKKTPTVHVWGNDVRVGSALESADNADSKIQSLTIPGDSGNYFGSWSEYGAIAPADISGFASGAGLYGGNTNDPIDWSNLTFANATSPYGSFVADTNEWRLGTLPKITQDSFSDYTPYVGNLNNVGGWYGNNRNVIINTSGDVVIKNDITASPSLKNYNDVDDMPQMVIIAKNILIKAKVEQIDAWLIASETINTCGLDTTETTPILSPHTSQCDDPLTINGPVVAKNLLLFRTHGADSIATLDEPAETINFSADSYVWARHQAEQSGGLRTVAIRELPPRF